MRPTRALVLAALLGGAAGAQENVAWVGEAGEDEASLFYGIPQSGYAPIVFYCTPEAEELVFVYEFAPIDAREGVAVEVTLQAGDIVVPIQTVGHQLDMDDLFILVGHTPLDARLIDLVTSRGTLIVFVEDGAEEYPLDGAREAAGPLIETCRPE